MRDPHYIPKPTKHSSGQAVIRLNGRDHYLGPFGSLEAKTRYEDLISRWLANGRSLPDVKPQPTINDVLLAYLRWATIHYHRVGKPDTQIAQIKDAVRVVKNLFGRALA